MQVCLSSKYLFKIILSEILIKRQTETTTTVLWEVSWMPRGYLYADWMSKAAPLGICCHLLPGQDSPSKGWTAGDGTGESQNLLLAREEAACAGRGLILKAGVSLLVPSPGQLCLLPGWKWGWHGASFPGLPLFYLSVTSVIANHAIVALEINVII